MDAFDTKLYIGGAALLGYLLYGMSSSEKKEAANKCYKYKGTERYKSCLLQYKRKVKKESKNLTEHYLEYLDELDLKQVGGPPGPKVSIQQKRIPYVKKTDFVFKPPGGAKGIVKGQKSKFVRKSPVKEDAAGQLAYIGGAATGVLVTTLAAWAHKKYEDWYGKANRACGKMKGSEGRLCRQNYKVQAAKAEIQALKFARSKCRRAKDSKLCVQQLNQKIRDLMDKHPDIEYTMKAIGKHKQD
jgi:hypothetical protein